jgi:uncharacterized membrane protein/sporulation protein YlmC with PRC-barrel domain
MMKQIPLDAEVRCSDGRAGTSSHVIFDPTSRRVTHFVVSDDRAVDPQYFLVPIDLVTDTIQGSISLACTKEELAQLAPFMERHYIENPGMETGYPADSVYLAPYVTPVDLAYLPVELERVPVGELALHREAEVVASDGHVGQVDELVLDPESGAITHFILRSGHAWGKKEVAIPVSAVAETLEDTVTLKLDKEAVGRLPAIPVKRRYRDKGEARTVELLAKLFSDEARAGETLKEIRRSSREEGASFKVLEAAVLVKGADGKTKIKETGDLHAAQGRMFGAVVGGLVGLLGGPVGVVLGALAGAGTGAFTAKHVDLGFSDDFLESLEEHLEPGSSALLVMVDHTDADAVFQELAAKEGVMLRHAFTDSIVEELLAATEG